MNSWEYCESNTARMVFLFSYIHGSFHCKNRREYYELFESNSYTMVVNKWYTFYWNFVYKLLRGVWCIYSSYIACLFVNVRKFAIVFFVIKSTIYVAKVYKASIITISITSDLLYLNFSLARNGFLSLHKAMPNVISSKDVLHVNVQIDIWITNDRFCNFYALSCPVDDSTK